MELDEGRELGRAGLRCVGIKAWVNNGGLPMSTPLRIELKTSRWSVPWLQLTQRRVIA